MEAAYAPILHIYSKKTWPRLCISLAVAAGRGTKGTSAPDGTVQGAAFGGAEYGILKFDRFW